MKLKEINGVLYLDNGREITVEEISEKLLCDAHKSSIFFDDETAFVKYLMYKYDEDITLDGLLEKKLNEIGFEIKK